MWFRVFWCCAAVAPALRLCCAGVGVARVFYPGGPGLNMLARKDLTKLKLSGGRQSWEWHEACVVRGVLRGGVRGVRAGCTRKCPRLLRAISI